MNSIAKETFSTVRHTQRRKGRFGAGRALLAVPAACVLLLCMGAYLRRQSRCHMSTHDAAEQQLNNSDDATGLPHGAEDRLVSNGTHWFRPTLIVVSLDGFRADYMDRGFTPELVKLGRRGLRADYMVPSFPSSTFPNHYTIVTGLYPGSHGIVSNEFYDATLNSTFVYKDPKRSIDPRWWENAEPIWVTAEKQGVRAGINMWPGSTSVIHGRRPTYLVPYAGDVAPTKKVDKVLEWLDLPLSQRPSLLATYMPEVDSAAHRKGPNDATVNSAAHLVDAAVGRLWAEVERRNLTGIVNLMVVSDHGMAESHAGDNAIYIDDIIDTTRLRGIYGWPLAGLQPYDQADVPLMYAKLKAASVGQPWTVYLRDQIPDRFHYTFASRTAPVFVIPDAPYYVTTRDNDAFYTSHLGSNPEKGAPMGVHGYDNTNPLMRATFVAVGPAFRSRDTPAPALPNALPPPPPPLPQGMVRIMNGTAPAHEQAIDDGGSHVSDMDAMQDYLELVRNAVASSSRGETTQEYHGVNDYAWGDSKLTNAQLRNIRHPPFENVELYALMARILHLVPAPNNGTTEFSRWWLRQ